MTAKSEAEDVVAGLEAGGDEYLTKPVDQKALVARVKSMLRIKELHDTTQKQAERIEADAARLAELNESLQKRVAQQVAELERQSEMLHQSEKLSALGEVLAYAFPRLQIQDALH